MALYDNKHWMLSHIRHSFIFSDETGYSEMVMMDEDLRVPSMKAYPGLDQDDEDEDGDLARSLDVHGELDFGAHRRRTNTAQKLEKLDLERKRVGKITNIKWEDPTNAADNSCTVFEKKVLDKSKAASSTTRRVSTLSAQLKDCPVLQKNPFFDYSLFDGNAQVGTPVKRFLIFVTFFPRHERDYPLNVTIVNTAKVRELIGFVLWKCSVEKNIQSLLEDLNEYSIHIAEDNGEVDWDFPCLDENEAVSKFGFNYLALVQKTESSKSRAPTVSMPLSSTGWSALAEKDEKEIEGAEDSAVKQQAQREAEQRMRGHMTAMEAPLYQSFQVYILNRVRVRSSINLGISGDKIEIDPVVQHKTTSQLWGKKKAATYDVTRIAACEITHQRTNKSSFRLVHQPTDESAGVAFKTLEFEAEHSIAQEIVQKINHILELRSGPVRKEYQTAKERKSTRRRSSRSFSFSLK